MQFADLNLHPVLLRRLAAIGYAAPTPIQAQAIPSALAGRDVIGLGPTGTGKTAAFIVPVAQELLADPARPRDPRERLRALVICPTRELAQQVADEGDLIVRGSVLRVGCAFGGVSINPQAMAIASGLDILVVTPGRARELLDAGHLSLASIRFVVLDEADRVLDMGFLPQVESILQRVPSGRRMLLFTATMPKEVETLAARFLVDPVRIEAGTHTRPASHVRQRAIAVEDDEKTPLLLKLLADPAMTGVVVFARTRRRVGWVSTALSRHGVSVTSLHGDRSQAQRRRALDEFAAGNRRVIVATDVAARGLHVEAVRVVINYDLPQSVEEYVHRVGRAGHGGELASPGAGTGEAISLVSRDERGLWREIAAAAEIEVQIEEPTPPEERPRRERSDRPKSSRRRDRAEAGTGAEAPRRSKRAAKAANERDPVVKKGQVRRRRRASRPIARGEKPGGGVRKKN